MSDDNLLPALIKNIGNEPYTIDLIGMSYLFADTIRSRARFCEEYNHWLIFDGTRWREDSGGSHIAELAKLFKIGLSKSTLKIKKTFVRENVERLVKRLDGRAIRSNLIKDSQSVCIISISEFDKDPYILNCLNGTLNLATGAFTNHAPNDFLLKLAGVSYDPTVKCVRWESFMDEVMQGDIGKIHFLQKAFGYTLTGDTSQNCFFILLGKSTRNGKGVTISAFKKLMGSYAKVTYPETIVTKRNPDSRSHSEDIARLEGARFVSISEPCEDHKLNAAFIRTLTGEDDVSARFLHKGTTEFSPQFKIFIDGNYLMINYDKKIFDSDRVMIIPFERHFEKHERDMTLRSQLTTSEALSGILNWCIEGYNMFRDEGLESPRSVLNAIHEYKEISDVYLQFIKGVLVESKGSRIHGAKVYASFKEWCKDRGISSKAIVISTKFYEELRERGVRIAKTGKIQDKQCRNIIIGYDVQ
jgi:putative DNA primase/helicase